MSKFHIDKNGKPAICKAKPGNCPLGGNESHFNSKEEAQKFIDLKNEEKYGKLPGVNRKKSPFGIDLRFDSIEEAQSHADEQNKKEFGILSQENKVASGYYVGYYYDLSEQANENMIRSSEPLLTKDNFNQVLDSGFNGGDIDVKYEYGNDDNTSIVYEGTLVKVGEDKYKALGKYKEYLYEERDFDYKEKFDEYVKEGHDKVREVDLEFSGDELRKSLEEIDSFREGWAVNKHQAPPTVLRGIFKMIKDN